jgi:hypothetical protein
MIKFLIKFQLKNNTQTIFQGDSPWLTQIRNNRIVWMVLYCVKNKLG